jgi:hypothetical protein
MITRLLAFLLFCIPVCHGGETWPGKEWESCAPEAAGLSPDKLTALREIVGGRGCVVRRAVPMWPRP